MCLNGKTQNFEKLKWKKWNWEKIKRISQGPINLMGEVNISADYGRFSCPIVTEVHIRPIFSQATYLLNILSVKWHFFRQTNQRPVHPGSTLLQDLPVQYTVLNNWSHFTQQEFEVNMFTYETGSVYHTLYTSPYMQEP